MLPFVITDSLINRGLYGRGGFGQDLIIGFLLQFLCFLPFRRAPCRHGGRLRSSVPLFNPCRLSRRRRRVIDVPVQQQPRDLRYHRNQYRNRQLPTEPVRPTQMTLYLGSSRCKMRP